MLNNRQKLEAVVVSIIVLAALAYAITLQATGQPKIAEDFVKSASEGIGSLVGAVIFLEVFL